MQERTPIFSRDNLWTALLVWVVLACVYFFSYSAFIESGDSLQYADAVSSLVRYGDWLLDETHWFGPRYYVPSDNSYALLPLTDPDRLSVVFATPLFVLADALPGIGTLQAIWLFGVIVTATTGALVYFCARALNYAGTTAVIAALLFGLTTNAWAYSKTFFPGVLLACWFAWVTLCLIAFWRSGGRGRLLWLAGIVAGAIGAVLTKNAAVMALPALIVALLPDVLRVKQRPALARLTDALLLIGVILLAAVIYIEPLYDFAIATVSPLLERLTSRDLYARDAIHSYLFSAGGSVWGTSPVLLGGLIGAMWLLRRGKRRIVWGCALLLVSYAVGYGVLTGPHWFGGLSWAPRFMLPLLPVLMLPVMPLIHRATERGAWGWRVIVLLLAIYGLWIQFVAVSLPWLRYPDVLPPQADGLISWLPGMNAAQYFRWVILPESWASLGFDFAWYRSDMVAVPLGLAGIVAAALWLLFNQRRWLVAALVPAWGVVVLLALHGYFRHDPLFLGHQSALHDAVAIVQQEARSGDVLLLTGDTYHRFMLNAGDVRPARAVILATQPGEAPGPDQPPQVTSLKPIELLRPSAPLTIYQIAQHRPRLWVLADNSEFIPFAVRPVERFLSQHYYLRRSVPLPTADATVRLYEYVTEPAPAPYTARTVEQTTDFTFGDHIRLDGFTLPRGDTYTAGDYLPLSLRWRTDAPLDVDYVVAWFLADASGAVAVHGSGGMDTIPAAGFAPTTQWQPDQPVWDHRALRLPDTLNSGDYVLWVRLYTAGADGQPAPLDVQGGDTAEDGTIAVLPVTITVAPDESSSPEAEASF